MDDEEVRGASSMAASAELPGLDGTLGIRTKRTRLECTHKVCYSRASEAWWE